MGKSKDGVMRKSRADKAKAMMMEDTFDEIVVPPIGDIPEYSMKVMVSNSPMVSVEFNVANIEYLQRVVEKQLVDGNMVSRYGRGFNNEGCKGLSALYSEDGSVKKLRIKKRRPDADGPTKVACKSIRVDGELASATAKALMAFEKHDEAADEDTSPEHMRHSAAND